MTPVRFVFGVSSHRGLPRATVDRNVFLIRASRFAFLAFRTATIHQGVHPRLRIMYTVSCTVQGADRRLVLTVMVD